MLLAPRRRQWRLGLTGCLAVGSIWVWSSAQSTAADRVALLAYRGGFRAETARLAIQSSTKLQLRVFLKNRSDWVTLSPEKGLPSCTSVKLEGQTAITFAISGPPSLQQGIHTRYGEADQVSVPATDSAHRVGLSLRLIFPQDLPDVVILESHLKSLRSSPALTISEFDQAAIRLAPLGYSGSNPRFFWSLQGGAYEWGKDYVLPVRADFFQDNSTGPKGNGNGGGTPLVDLWRPEMGVAVALLDRALELSWLPVRSDHRGVADLRVVTRPQANLSPGNDYTPSPVMIVAHQLDFYDAVVRYREVMDRLGLHVAQNYQPGDFAPAWCTWGFKRKFTLAQLEEKIPQMQATGAKDFILDDGWFDRFGDWEPAPQKFPGNEADMKAFIGKIHSANLTFRLWWSPGSADEGSELDKHHPEWFILDKSGHREKASWDAYYLCPAYAPVQAYTRALVTRFVKDWSVDAFKLDGNDLNHAPLCFNPAHHHRRPEESFEQWPGLLRQISETARSIRPNFRIEFCPCGLTPTFQLSAIFEQPTDSDPYDYQVTSRVKFLKAQLGPHSPVLQEYVGLRGFYDAPYLADRLKAGVDLYPRAIGTGEVPSTFSPVLAKTHADWTAIYNTYRPAEGEYLNLYDIRWETPEGHAIRKGDKFFYGFFTQIPGRNFTGTVQLRGLVAGREYQVLDYVRNQTLDHVVGPVAELPVKFSDGLLLVAIPAKP